MPVIGASGQKPNRKKMMLIEIDEDLWFKFGKLAKHQNSDRAKKIRIFITDYINNHHDEVNELCQPLEKVVLRRKPRSA